MPRLTAARSAVRSSHVLPKTIIHRKLSVGETTFAHLHMRPLIYLDAGEPVAIHPATDGSVSPWPARKDGA